MTDLLLLAACTVAGYLIGRHVATRDTCLLLAFLIRHGELRPDGLQRALRRERDTHRWS